MSFLLEEVGGHCVFLHKPIFGPWGVSELDSERPLILLVIIPKKVIVDVGNEAFPQCSLRPPVILVPVELQAGTSKMSARNPHRSQKTPSHAVEVATVKGVLLIAVKQCLWVEVEHFEEE